MKKSRAQIIATIGPACENEQILTDMILSGVDIFRFNLSWGNDDEHLKYLNKIRSIEEKISQKVLIIFDLPGPRIQQGKTHTYNKEEDILTENNKNFIKLGIENLVDYFALSFVGDSKDVLNCRDTIRDFGGNQKIIAKIERKIAVENIFEIIKEADAVMVARGDLGEEVPIEQIPFIQEDIIKKAESNNRPVVVATQMLLSMVEKSEPTRAEVTDVANAIMEGADAVMLSDETAIGKYPVETVKVMEKIILESEKHNGLEVNLL
jgi:pyruvate kinase